MVSTFKCNRSETKFVYVVIRSIFFVITIIVSNFNTVIFTYNLIVSNFNTVIFTDKRKIETLKKRPLLHTFGHEFDLYHCISET